jgi:alpha-L-fucosidase 2
MKKLLILACASFLFVLPTLRPALSSTNYLMWYNAPGTGWTTGYLPIGNSLFGAGLMGGVAVDSMFLNDNAAYSSTGGMRGLGWMKIAVTGTSGYTGYRRDLDLGEATAHVSYTAGGKNYSREYFCSLPDTVMVCHYTCPTPGSFGLTVQIVPNDSMPGKTVVTAGNTITYTGHLPVVYTSGGNFNSNWNFHTRTYVRNYNGSLTIVNGDQIQVTNADSVDIIFTSSHNFKLSYAAGFRTSVDVDTMSANRINAALAKSYATLRANHLVDYQGIFNRFTLDLNDSISKGTPTDVRIQNNTPGTFNDRGLEVLWTQFYRYIMISASRAQLPAGLQAMWGPKWAWYCSGGYYMNQNFQMNY